MKDSYDCVTLKIKHNSAKIIKFIYAENNSNLFIFWMDFSEVSCKHIRLTKTITNHQLYFPIMKDKIS